MSNSSLGFSFIESTNKIKEKLKPKKKPIKIPEPVMEEFKGGPDLEPEMEGDDDGELANVDFSPPPKPESSGVERAKSKEKALARKEQHPAEPFTKMSENFSKEYFEEYIPFSHPQLNTGHPENSSKGELEKKLNYMIHLLEDQKDERTGGMTEEIVLYCFLGVFIIFVLDSFAKVGKYVR
jgi:hypothetical protein